MGTKQTAVDYLLHELSDIIGVIAPDAFSAGLMKIKYEQAKAMEKEQMIKFALNLHNVDMSKTGTDILTDEAEKYYKITYGK
jgi:DNA transposition AAA+ family ATPase